MERLALGVATGEATGRLVQVNEDAVHVGIDERVAADSMTDGAALEASLDATQRARRNRAHRVARFGDPAASHRTAVLPRCDPIERHEMRRRRDVASASAYQRRARIRTALLEAACCGTLHGCDGLFCSRAGVSFSTRRAPPRRAVTRPLRRATPSQAPRRPLLPATSPRRPRARLRYRSPRSITKNRFA